MKIFILICLMLIFCIMASLCFAGVEEVKIGMTPRQVNKILGTPKYEWVRGYFHNNERFFYWKYGEIWIYGAFWTYPSKTTFRLQYFIFVMEPCLGRYRDGSTSGPHICIKVKEKWLPFKQKFPTEYLRQLTEHEVDFMKEYMPEGYL